MAKLSLVIADQDGPYLESLADYLLACYPQKFQIRSFCDVLSLTRYLAEDTSPIDILLITPEMYVTELALENTDAVILLMDSRKKQQVNDLQNMVDKFQSGDRLVDGIMKIYARVSPGSSHRAIIGKSKLVAVYSPIGGSGKTTIAVGSSIQSVWEGKEVLYLNLEDFSSTSLYFDATGNISFSEVLYYLKDCLNVSDNILESAVCRDSKYKVHFFCPPISVLDYHEVTEQQVRSLLRQLAGSGRYDRIFIDLSSELNINNLTVLEECDEILLITVPSFISTSKTNTLFKEFAAWEHRKKIRLTEKARYILNKYEPTEEPLEAANIGNSLMLKIPRVDGLIIPDGNRYRLDMNSSFGTAIYQLMIGI